MWNRGLSLSGFYTYGQNYDNTDGAFVDPREPDPRQRVGTVGVRSHATTRNIAITSTALRNLTARFGVAGSSAPPLTIRTGTDDNGDLVFNDRPDGVGRNSARTTGRGTRRRTSATRSRSARRR